MRQKHFNRNNNKLKLINSKQEDDSEEDDTAPLIDKEAPMASPKLQPPAAAAAATPKKPSPKQGAIRKRSTKLRSILRPLMDTSDAASCSVPSDYRAPNNHVFRVPPTHHNTGSNGDNSCNNKSNNNVHLEPDVRIRHADGSET